MILLFRSSAINNSVLSCTNYSHSWWIKLYSFENRFIGGFLERVRKSLENVWNFLTNQYKQFGLFVDCTAKSWKAVLCAAALNGWDETRSNDKLLFQHAELRNDIIHKIGEQNHWISFNFNPFQKNLNLWGENVNLAIEWKLFILAPWRVFDQFQLLTSMSICKTNAYSWRIHRRAHCGIKQNNKTAVLSIVFHFGRLLTNWLLFNLQ